MEQLTPSGDGGPAQNIGDALDAVFAQHQQLLLTFSTKLGMLTHKT